MVEHCVGLLCTIHYAAYEFSFAGPFVPGCADLMTEYSSDGSFVRLYYPTSLTHIQVVCAWSVIDCNLWTDDAWLCETKKLLNVVDQIKWIKIMHLKYGSIIQGAYWTQGMPAAIWSRILCLYF